MSPFNIQVYKPKMTEYDYDVIEKLMIKELSFVSGINLNDPEPSRNLKEVSNEPYSFRLKTIQNSIPGLGQVLY